MAAARTTGEARRRWNTAEASWRQVGEALVSQIQGIEDPNLQHAVGGILDIIASGFGALIIRRIPKDGRLEMHHLHLDPDTYQALERATSEVTINEALKWLQARLHGQEVLTLVYLLGHLREETPVPAGLKPMLQFEVNGFVYDLREQRVLGIRLENGRVWKPT